MSEEITTTKDTTKKDAPKADTKTATVQDVSQAQPKRKRGAKQVSKAQVRIKSTYNNTIVTVTDLTGATLGWGSAGMLGFKGAKKSTPYAASQVVSTVVEKIAKHNIKELQVFVKGVGGGRDAAIRAFAANGFDISLIKDTTPVAHNGCTKRKPRRV